MHRTSPMFCGIVFLFAAPVAAGDPPEAIAQAYMQHLVQGKPGEAIELVDKQDVDDFHRFMQPLLLDVDPAGNPLFMKMFGEGVSKESLSDMTPKEFFEGFIGVISSAFTRSANFQAKNIQVVGVVRENDTHSHVLLRLNFEVDERRISLMEVISLRLVDQDWVISFGEKIGLMKLSLRPLIREGKAGEAE